MMNPVGALSKLRWGMPIQAWSTPAAPNLWTAAHLRVVDSLLVGRAPLIKVRSKEREVPSNEEELLVQLSCDKTLKSFFEQYHWSRSG
ncbi:hypothetical protein AVEN_86822-1 [Araneus ventricosus]|uniref:Uncharacterized protein n=1 Tax=Araneus ventricosus TaxID=182803 RepID=A0A4Y2CZS2_ARAVE|nr:hypothetical protein AVEN_86822-1 [Araneus ventricosus]